MITHGNFFSGSGCWELAARLCGATTLWESEIEPFPVELEAKRFPEAKQLGDITKVSGYDIEPVDIMSNSSPCQSISVAGKRHGMAAGSVYTDYKDGEVLAWMPWFKPEPWKGE